MSTVNRLVALAAMACVACAFSPPAHLQGRHGGAASSRSQRVQGRVSMSAESAQEAYKRKLLERREAIERGEGMDYATNPELMSLMVENRDALLDESELGEDEIARLREASLNKLAIAEGIQGMNAAASVVDPEEEEEFERALLDMFLKQGDIDEEALSSVGKAATEPQESKPDFEAIFRRDMAKLRGSESKLDERVTVELDQPLDLGTSQELLKQMGKYQEMEKEVWNEVKAESQSEGFTAPEKFPETFRID